MRGSFGGSRLRPSTTASSSAPKGPGRVSRAAASHGQAARLTSRPRGRCRRESRSTLCQREGIVVGGIGLISSIPMPPMAPMPRPMPRSRADQGIGRRKPIFAGGLLAGRLAAKTRHKRPNPCRLRDLSLLSLMSPVGVAPGGHSRSQIHAPSTIHTSARRPPVTSPAAHFALPIAASNASAASISARLR
jgi:hypothetical protein